jgi:hypothetical protein
MFSFLASSDHFSRKWEEDAKDNASTLPGGMIPKVRIVR